MSLPHANVTRAVIQRYARLLTRYSKEIGERPLVLPNATYFPDIFNGDPASASRLCARMQTHAGMQDIPISVEVIESGASPSASSCSSGACGIPQSGGELPRLAETEQGYVVQIPAIELRHPVALTTNLARSLSYIFLVETQREGERLEPPVDVTADFLAVALGFGPLMLEGSYIYAKGCSGPQLASVTKVPLAELSVIVALFAHLGNQNVSAALRTLSLTQRSALEEANSLIAANPELLELLESDPETIARGRFELEESRGFLSGFFRKRRKTRAKSKLVDASSLDPTLSLDELEAMMIAMPPSSRAGRSRPAPMDDELAELVSESFGGARS